MLSSKCQKYMSQYQERNYASKSRKIEKNNLRKHSDGSEIGQACEASRSDCIQQSRQEEKIDVKELLDEESRKDESLEALEGRQEGIQGTDQRRCKASKRSEKKKKVEKKAK